MWKIKAFIDMVKSIDCSLVTNIVCVGDSFIEIEAAKALASKFNQAVSLFYYLYIHSKILFLSMSNK